MHAKHVAAQHWKQEAEEAGPPLAVYIHATASTHKHQGPQKPSKIPFPSPPFQTQKKKRFCRPAETASSTAKVRTRCKQMFSAHAAVPIERKWRRLKQKSSPPPNTRSKIQKFKKRKKAVFVLYRGSWHINRRCKYARTRFRSTVETLMGSSCRHG